MSTRIARRFLAFAGVILLILLTGRPLAAQPFGPEFPMLETTSTGEWWKAGSNKEGGPNYAVPGSSEEGKKPRKRFYNLNVPRDQVVAFTLYTQDRSVLKLTAQLFPLFDEEPREARLEFRDGDTWHEAAKVEVLYPGWSAHFRIEDWDGTNDVPYRVRHGEKAMFEGMIRRDPADKDEIVIASLSCDGSNTLGMRENIVNNLLFHDPDLLFFAGDQTYHHTEHTAGWIEFGMRYRELLKDRPTISIPDDHDVGQANLWGESGKVATNPDGASGGYFYPPAYVNQVQRQQAWHLPDPYDPTAIERDISVYYTSLRVGGIDFAILEDRKFKSGPMGKIPPMGPRPDHINDPSYDRSAINLPDLELLGQRQLDFLAAWGEDWSDASMKAVLSQTAFCGAVHIHGQPDNRLLADLDCNGWPQHGRDEALRAIRRVWGTHLCGDQHLAVSVQHGIEAFRDGPFAFTSPALVNTIYGRWWHPLDEQAGPNPVPDSPLPWTGDFEDGLGNKISMLAYANPEDRTDEKKRSEGYGITRYRKSDRSITFECWDRWADASTGSGQFSGWPVTVSMEDNDGRKKTHWLPVLKFASAEPVVTVIRESDGEVLYTVRIQGDSFQPAVYGPGTYSVKVGANRPEAVVLEGFEAVEDAAQAGGREIP